MAARNPVLEFIRRDGSTTWRRGWRRKIQAWSSKKMKQTKIAETVKISVKVDKNRRIRWVLEDLGNKRIHSDVPHDLLL